MARQNGILKIEGTLNDMTFYQMHHRHFVRAKRKVSRERILSDPQFVRVMENANEFSRAVIAGKLLRDTVKSSFKEAGSRDTSTRLLSRMLEIQKLDGVSARGKRNVAVALALDDAKKLLKGFEFNSRSSVQHILRAPYDLNIVTGEIVIDQLTPIRDVEFAEGATHVTLRGAFALVDFSDGVSAIEYSNEVILPRDSLSTDVILTPASSPTGTGTKIYLLQIEFLQAVNGAPYALNDGRFNGFVIADVG